ncbi:putative leader peptide [Streptomyces sp. NPDC050619]|uniref:putative leader peptide n=1 Tax=Streptomyces sp. NPDC050619 TaxID=3157214 RepID=UPI00341E3902
MNGNTARGRGVVTHDEICAAPPRAPRCKEVTAVTRTLHAVHLHSRPHIDLQRVAGALCCS